MEKHSEETEKNIDAVAMTRRIRDERHEHTKEMSPAERLRYYRQQGAVAHEWFMEGIRDRTDERRPE